MSSSGSGVAVKATATPVPPGSYAGYDYYTDTFGGTLISSTEFYRLSREASAFVNAVTFGRAEDVTDADLLDKIKMAVCAAADLLLSQEKNGGVIQSETVGSHSVSYAQAQQRSAEAQLTQAVKLWLGQTGLMYRGLDAD